MEKPPASLLGNLLQLSGAELEHANRYECSRVIGEGGMAKILLGWDTHLKREVAIKVVTSGDGADDRKRFNREARVLASLRHPGVVQLVDYSGPDAARQYIVMERLRGHTLDYHVQRRTLPEDALAALAYQLLEAVQPAHDHGIVHRDIKPENVFLENDGRVVIIDFGLAKGTALTASRNTFMPGSTKMLGTPEFSCPEVLSQSAPLSPQSDLFSLGSTLYFASTGKPPFRSDRILELVKQVIGQAHPPLTQLSTEMRQVIDQLLQKHPEQRPAAAKQLLPLLAAVLKRFDGVSPQEILVRYVQANAGDTAPSLTSAAPVKAKASGPLPTPLAIVVALAVGFAPSEPH